METVGEGILHSILNKPAIFNPFSRYLGDQRIVEEVIRTELRLSGNENILDLGCGTGNLSRMFSSEKYVGVDFNKSYIDFARKTYNKKFVTMNASNLQFAGNYFDLIFSKDIYHHLDDETFLKVLSEIKRVIKPNGELLIIEISYQASDDVPYKKLLRQLDRGKYIREFDNFKKMIANNFCVRNGYIKKGVWGDLAVFLAHK